MAVVGPLGVGLGFGANVVLAALLARPLWARAATSQTLAEPAVV